MAPSTAPPTGWRARRLAVLATTAAALPLLVALARAQRDGWYPSGDNAYFSLRARDVLTADHPLLGTWTSASLTAGADVNNPGPLLFDLLALPAKVDHRLGVAVGAVAVNMAAIVGMVLAGWRIGGQRMALLAAAMGAALAWTLGSGILVEPWQPHSLLLPALCFFVLVWGVVHGCSILWPWTVVVGSLLLQTHLTYAYLVTGMSALAAAALWHRRTPGQPPWGPGGPARHLVLGGVIGLVLWAQPLADQLGGRGNLGHLLSSVGNEPGTTGWSYGARLTATVLAAPGLWARGDFGPALVPEPLQPRGVAGPGVALQEVPGPAAAAIGLCLLGLVLVGAFLVARRAGDRMAVDGLLTAAIAGVLAFGTTATLPIGVLGLGPHQLRFLWPLGVLLSATAALAVAGRARWWAAALVVVTLGLAAANLPGQPAPVGPSSERTAMAVLDDLVPQLDRLDRDLVYLIDSERSRLFEPYTTPLMLELQARGIDFTVSYQYTVPQVGERRREHGQADATLAVVEGPGVLDVPQGQVLVAVVLGLGDDEQRELEVLTERVRAHATRSGVSLTDAGERAREVGLLPVLAGGSPGDVPVDGLLASGELAIMVTSGYIDPPPAERADYERWAELHTRWYGQTVGVWQGPAPVVGR